MVNFNRKEAGNVEWLKGLAETVGVEIPSPYNWIILAIGVLWLVYNNAHKQVREDQDRVRRSLDDLYSPALGMLKSRTSSKLSEDKFREMFTELLINERSKGSKEVGALLDSWLDGEPDETLLEARLVLECRRAANRVRDTRTLSVWETVWWMSDLYFNMLRSAGGLLISVGIGLGLGGVLANSSNLVRVVLVVGITVFGFLLKFLHDKREHEELAQELRVLERRRLRRRSQSVS